MAMKACVRKSSTNWEISLKNSVMKVSYDIVKVSILLLSYGRKSSSN